MDVGQDVEGDLVRLGGLGRGHQSDEGSLEPLENLPVKLRIVLGKV